MNFPYSRSRLRNDVNSGIHNRIDMLVDPNRLINNAVRDVMADVDLSTAKRKAPLGTGIFDRVNEYPAPSDLSADNVIDIVSEHAGARERDWSMATNNVMNGNTGSDVDAYQKHSQISVSEHDGRKHIMLSADIDDENRVISTLDSVSDESGTWEPVGDTDEITANRYAYVKGSGSLTFSMNEDNTDRAGIENTSVSTFELQEDLFDGVGSFFTWVFLPQTDGIKGVNLDVGSSGSDFFSMTTNQRHDGTSLDTGWNLVRFDLSHASDVGSVDLNNMSYVRLTVGKDTDLENVSGFRFDHIVFRVSSPQNIYYYTAYPWVSLDGVYKREATTDTDRLVASKDEYRLFELKALKRAYEESKESQAALNKEQEYQNALQNYKVEHPSEAMIVTEQYHEFHNPTVGDPNRIID